MKEGQGPGNGNWPTSTVFLSSLASWSMSSSNLAFSSTSTSDSPRYSSAGSSLVCRFLSSQCWRGLTACRCGVGRWVKVALASLMAAYAEGTDGVAGPPLGSWMGEGCRIDGVSP